MAILVFLTPRESLAAETSEMTLPIASDTTIVSKVEPAEFVEPTLAFGANLDQSEAEAAALDWLQNELQMSIDPDVEPQGDNPDYSCMNPPYYCSSTEKCFLKGKVSTCAVTSCNTGECSACPIKNPGVIIASWCAYSCMAGKDVVGGAFKLRTSWGTWLGPVCFEG